jgi:hypothetical protein
MGGRYGTLYTTGYVNKVTVPFPQVSEKRKRKARRKQWT